MSYSKPKLKITCQGCGKVFEVIPSQAQRKFCSTQCASPEKKVTLICERCGKAFEARPSTASGKRFCSIACRKSQVSVTCDVCGKVFETNTYQAERGRRFCSRECRNNSQIKVTCETCGKVFGVSPTRAKRARYCSKACIPVNKVTLTCQTCDQPFEVWPSRAETAKFCSYACGDGSKVKVACVTCGKEFELIQSKAELPYKKYCSPACSHKDRAKIICQTCGKVFDVPQCRAEEARYCSRKCSGQQLAKKKVKLICKGCGKEFEVGPARAKRTKYCSAECKIPAKVKITCGSCGKAFYVLPSDSGRLYCSASCSGRENSLKRRTVLEDVKDDVARLYESGFTSREIGALYGVTPPAVFVSLRKSGIKIRKSPNNGVISKTKDGHMARSSLEKAVDNWLFDHNIEHECEPICPWDKSPHPCRADFKVGDFYIEVWGLIGRRHYDQQRAQKVAKYKEHGVKLIEILPAHVAHKDFSMLEVLLPSR